jgi:hypothetical protein
MQRFLGAVLVAALALGSTSSAWADDAEANAIVDKAIKAAGGAEKLAKLGVVSWKSKGVIVLGGNENPVSSQSTIQDFDHFRSEFEGEFNGNTIKGVTVLNGDKGWRKFNDQSMPMDENNISITKRTLYVQLLPVTLVLLKDKKIKLETAGDEKVGDAAAAVLKVTGPDGKDFKLFFSKESGLPVKLIAKVTGLSGDETTQESLFSDYKEFNGVKRATKIVSKRDGERFSEQEITDFQAKEKAAPGTFDEP